jgi:hypothetical protein
MRRSCDESFLFELFLGDGAGPIERVVELLARHPARQRAPAVEHVVAVAAAKARCAVRCLQTHSLAVLQAIRVAQHRGGGVAIAHAQQQHSAVTAACGAPGWRNLLAT